MFAAYASIISAVAPVFILLLIGGILRQRAILAEGADQSLMKMVINVLYPCLIFRFIVGNPALDQPRNLIIPPLVGFVSIIAGFWVAWWIGRKLGLQIGRGLRSFAFTNGIYNYGYMPIPLIIAIFPDNEGILGVLMVFNVGVEMAIWTVGIVLVSGQFTRDAFRKILNPPIIALILALTVNGFGLDAHQPDWLENLIRMLGDCSIPLAIMLAGATLRDLKLNFALALPLRIPVAACGLRLLLLPLAFVLAALTFPGFSDELRQVLIVQAAMPAGIFPLVIARHFGGDPRIAAQVVFFTTVVSIVTIPLWIMLGQIWLG